MGKRLACLQQFAVGAFLLAASNALAAESELKVVKLRMEKVALYDCKTGAKKGEYARKEFRGSWRIIPSPLRDCYKINVPDDGIVADSVSPGWWPKRRYDDDFG